jgi:gamma-glutamyltranspeptidase/glutathione hydrolase
LLGRTLKRFGELGPAALIEGDTAKDWVAATAEYGGILTLTDLRDYSPKYRVPLRFSYGRYDIITAPPPSAGGMLLAQTLSTFLPVDLARHRSTVDRIQILAAAYRASFADRARTMGDPDFVTIDLDSLLNPEYLAKRRSAILSNTASSAPVVLPREHGTSHISVVDAAGNAVALTTTVNNAFGARILDPKSGVILNDELDDFGPSSSPNQPRPLGRPVSSMTPTIVLDGGRLRWVLGGSGGMAISTNVTTVLIAMLVDGIAPERAVEQPRFTVAPSSGELELEKQSPRSVARTLIARGERVKRVPRGISAVQVVAVTDAKLEAVADPRKHGRGTTATLVRSE